MASWVETAEEFNRRRGEPNYLDVVRRERYQRVESRTGRPLVIYAADFLNRSKVQACKGEIEIDLGDRDGIIEVTKNVSGKNIDVLIHSPGGIPEAADSLVHVLRNRFEDVRFIVPSIAKSAATMLALSGDRLLIERNAELGPIDPQIRFMKGDGTLVFAPAQAIIDQFEKAQDLLAKDPKRLPAWLPILQQYGPALYQQCKTAMDLSKDYVRRYLETWMYGGDKKRTERANAVVDYLADHNAFKTHGARVGYRELKDRGVNVDLLNDDPELQVLIEDVMYGITYCFLQSGVYKLFENSRGEALLRQLISQPMVLQAPMAPRVQ